MPFNIKKSKPLLLVGCGLSNIWFLSGSGWVSQWLRMGFPVAQDGFPSGSDLVSQWLRMGFSVAQIWFLSGSDLVSQWLKFGFSVDQGGFPVPRLYYQRLCAVSIGYVLFPEAMCCFQRLCAVSRGYVLFLVAIVYYEDNMSAEGSTCPLQPLHDDSIRWQSPVCRLIKDKPPAEKVD